MPFFLSPLPLPQVKPFSVLRQLKEPPCSPYHGTLCICLQKTSWSLPVDQHLLKTKAGGLSCNMWLRMQNLGFHLNLWHQSLHFYDPNRWHVCVPGVPRPWFIGTTMADLLKVFPFWPHPPRLSPSSPALIFLQSPLASFLSLWCWIFYFSLSDPASLLQLDCNCLSKVLICLLSHTWMSDKCLWLKYIGSILSGLKFIKLFSHFKNIWFDLMSHLTAF